MRHKSAVTVLSALAILMTQSPALPAHAQTDLTALWGSLAEPAFDSNQVAVVERVELGWDAATLTLLSGRLSVSHPGAALPNEEDRVVFAAFKGTGRLHFAPTLPLERQQLAFHTGQQALEAEFTEAIFIFAGDTWNELGDQLEFRSGDTADLGKLYRSRNHDLRRVGLSWEPRILKSLLAEEPTQHAFLVAELKTRKHGWLSLMVDEADPEQVELVKFDKGRRARNVWAKFPARGRRPQEVFADPLAHHDYRLKRYTLDVTVENNTKLQAEAEVNLEMKRSGERVLLLALDPNLRVTEVTDAAGQPLSFFQPRDPKDDFFLGDYLAVVAPKPFPVGDNTLRFRYAGKRIVRKVGNGNFFCQSFGWYPTYGMGRYSLTTNEFAARSDFDITLRVPKKFEAVAVGTKVDERKEENYRVTRWKSDIPLAVAGFAFGDYKVHTETVGDVQVEIYANRSADDALASIELLARMAKSGSTRTIGLHALAPSQLAEQMATEISNSLRVMEKFFGPYLYKKLAVTNIPYSYGQGWPSLLYISALSFLDSTQRSQLGIRDNIQLTDFFRAHETSHQWWGHTVGWKSYHDQWLSEGFAEFSGILYTMYRRNPKEYFRLFRKRREDLLHKDMQGAVYEQIGPIYAGQRLSSGKHPGGYSQIVYKKGGWVLHMIRMMLYDHRNRETPDHRFIAMMKDFTRTYHNRAASTEDFKAIVEKHMTPQMDLDRNGTMDWFFDSWIYGTGIPKYKFSYKVDPAAEAGKFVLKGTLRQSNVPENFRMIVPVFLHRGNKKVRLGWVTGQNSLTSFEVALDFKPNKVTINEWEDVLCTVE
jgi:hypothetical protein